MSAKYQLPDLLPTFEELKEVGDDILVPLSVTSDVIVERQGKAQKEVTVAHLHRYDFGDFFISFVYTPNRSSLTSAPSVLEARICLDRTEPLFFLSPYDTIPYINQSDLICRYFPYIESPERLKSCYRDLAESLVPYLADFTRISADSQELTKAYDNLRGEMVRCYGNNIFMPSGKGEDFDRQMLGFRFYHFVKWKSSFFSSNEYHQFLIGNYDSLTMLTARRAIPDYFRHLTLSVPALKAAPIKPVREPSASLSSMMRASKKASSFWLSLLATLLSLPIFGILFGILFYGVALIVGSQAEFSTALTLTAYLNTSNLILITAIVLSSSSVSLLLRLFAKKRYLAYRPYQLMLKKNPPHRFPKTLKRIVLVLALLFITLTASKGVLFNQDTISVPGGILPTNNIIIEYDDIEAVNEHTRPDGSFYYEFLLDNGDSFSLSSVMSSLECESIRDKLLPILQKHKITVQKRDDTQKPAATTPSTTAPETAPATTPDTTPDTTPVIPGKDQVTADCGASFDC